MKIKTVLMSVLSIFSVTACASDAHMIRESNGTTVYTDNFRVLEAEKNSKSADELQGFLGTLGDKIVVSGTKSSDHIAYVRHEDERHNYIIRNILMIQCAKDTECIPDDIAARKLSRSVYEITVDNYEEWKSVQERLRNAVGVKNVSPSLYYGVKPSLKNTKAGE